MSQGQTGRTAAQAVVDTLVRHNLPTMFALPGVQNDHFFDALHGALDRLRVIHPRHEQGAAFMAALPGARPRSPRPRR